MFPRGFRRISHPSLTDKDRGYHHLLFQRDNPDLIHKMKRDASATDVVRQLGLADGAPGEESTRQEAKRSPEPQRTENTTAQAHPPARSSNLSDLNMEPRQPVHPSLLQGVLGAQTNQGVSAQQHLEWQRQQGLLALQLGALQSANWGGLGSWNAGQHALPSASALAFGMAQQQLQQHYHHHHHQQQHQQQQQQHQQWQTNAALAQQQVLASVTASQSNPSSFQLPATSRTANSQETAQQQIEEEDSQPSTSNKNELS